MREVRRCDRNDFHAVFVRGFLGNQLVIVGIAAVGVETELDAKIAPPRSIEIEGSANQRISVVALCAGAMLIAHLASTAAAHHAPAQGALDQSFSVDHLWNL